LGIETTAAAALLHIKVLTLHARWHSGMRNTAGAAFLHTRLLKLLAVLQQWSPVHINLARLPAASWSGGTTV
jgi:hypothetical protein